MIQPPSMADKPETFASKFPSGVLLSQEVIDLFEQHRLKRQAMTFDELTLEDKPSEFHPNDTSLVSFVTRKIALKGCGILSAAMDTVTEREMALAMAQMGGMGILHRNLSAEVQSDMVKWVRKKIHYGGMVDKPITFAPTDHYSQLQREILEKAWSFTSFPIKDSSGRLQGLMTRDEMDFVEGTNPTLDQLMKPRSQIVTAPEGTDSERAYQIMKEQKVKKLPIVDKDDKLLGLYIWTDVKKDKKKRDLFSLDEEGHFLVGAAIGLGNDDIKRAQLLVESGCRVLVLDSSHGACKPAKDQIRKLREMFGNTVELIVGNVASYASATYLLEGNHKPDSLKVGIGPGSICTTRAVTGHGVPQATAIYEVWRAIQDHGKATGYYIPIIADGGIRTSGDIVKCLACGASGVMLGSALAGTDESPGKAVEIRGKRFKTIRGMGARSAMEERSGSRGRYYRQEDKNHSAEQLTNEQKEKMVPEGVEGLVEYKGSLEKVMFELLGGIGAGLAHSGAPTVSTFQKRATIWIQSFAGVAEGKPHNITDMRT